MNPSQVPRRLRDLLAEHAAALPLEHAHHLHLGLLPHQGALLATAFLARRAIAAGRRDALDAARC